jgi:hypothetical protein
MRETRTVGFVAALAALVAAGACKYEAAPLNGAQQCAPITSGKRCPDGYYCASDGTCWQSGQAPSDGGVPDVNNNTDAKADGTTDGATDGKMDGGPVDAFVPYDALPAPSGRAVVPGGSKASSSSYKMIKTLGQSPGGNRVRTSPSYRMVGGLIGATQK